MNKKLSLIIIASLLVAALLLSACGQALQIKAQNPSKPLEGNTSVTNLQTCPNCSQPSYRSLSVDGTGKVILVPDMAYINIGVRSEESDVTTALNRNNEIATQITDALKAKGVDPKDIQTANFSVYPSQKWDNMGNMIGTDFVVENTIYIKVKNLSTLGELLDEAVQAGANNVYGIQFDIQDRQAALDKARDLAIKDAQTKSAEVAKVAGVELGELMSINLSNSSFVQPYPMYGMGGGLAEMNPLDASVPVSAGQIIITYDASLIYAIH